MQEYIGKKLFDDTGRNPDYTINNVLFEGPIVIFGQAHSEENGHNENIYFMVYKESREVVSKDLMFYYMETQ